MKSTRNRSELSIEDISRVHNPVLQGWYTYYGRYYPSEMNSVFRHFNKTLSQWAMHKYKRLKRNKTRTFQFLEKIAKKSSYLFVHWEKGITNGFA